MVKKICFKVNGVFFSVPSLPFAWSYGPVIALENLARLLAVAHQGQVILLQYLDDILLLSTDRHTLEWDTGKLVSDLVSAGWVVSPKSVTVPTTSLTWLGKELNGVDLSIQQSPVYLAQMVVMWLRLASTGYYVKRARRSVGKVLWASSPRTLVVPFMQWPVAWTV